MFWPFLLPSQRSFPFARSYRALLPRAWERAARDVINELLLLSLLQAVVTTQAGFCRAALLDLAQGRVAPAAVASAVLLAIPSLAFATRPGRLVALLTGGAFSWLLWST
jgi:hypothetical protein